MSSGNMQFEKMRNYQLRKKVVTGTHTVKTGTTTYGFIFENPIDIDDPAADFTLTVPDGQYMGQTLLIVMSSNSSSKTCTVSVTHHANADAGTASLDAADEYLLLIWTGTEWDTLSYDGTSDVA